MLNLNAGQNVTVDGYASQGVITAVGELFPTKSRMAFRWITVRLDYNEGKRSIVVTDDKVRPIP